MRCLAALLLALLGLAEAQSCRAELERAAVLAGPRPGLRAAALLSEAHRLIEPAYPANPRPDAEPPPLAPGAAGFDDVRYLHERRLLPARWQRDEIDAVAWQRMIDRFSRGYGLEPIVVTEPVGLDSMIDDAERALAAVSAAVRPAALIATDQEDGETLVFLAVLWNWTPYPRLLVLNPAGHSLADGIEPLLGRIGSCALAFDSYILAREETAARLFLGSDSSDISVIGSDPEAVGRWPEPVDTEQMVATLSFGRPDLAELSSLSVAFEGPSSIGFFEAVGLFTRVRTNLSPSGLLYHLDFPPAP
jgi:hypothetical protein